MLHFADASIQGKVFSIRRSKNGKAISMLIEVVKNNSRLIVPLALIGTVAERYPATSIEEGDEVMAYGTLQYTRRNRNGFELLVEELDFAEDLYDTDDTDEGFIEEDVREQPVAERYPAISIEEDVHEQPVADTPANEETITVSGEQYREALQQAVQEALSSLVPARGLTPASQDATYDGYAPTQHTAPAIDVKREEKHYDEVTGLKKISFPNVIAGTSTPMN